MRTKFILSITALLMFAACAKDGEVGPVGPAGPQGAQGPTGAQGPQGEDGNANVSSQIAYIASSDWTASGTVQYVDFYTTLISGEIWSSGALICYIDMTGNGSYQQLPYTYYSAANVPITISASHSTGVVRFAYTPMGTTAITTSPGNKFFKLVAISSWQRAANPDLDYSDYEAVAAAYGLED